MRALSLETSAYGRVIMNEPTKYEHILIQKVSMHTSLEKSRKKYIHESMPTRNTSLGSGDRRR